MKNWKTTGTGILGLLTTIWACITTKSVGPAEIAAATTAIGLILSKDAGQSGTGF